MINILSTSREDRQLTLEIPSPPLTPSPRSSHHSPAPAIPAKPVPDDQAPNAVRDVSKLGSVVVFWRNVNSPKPDEREARAIPNSRGYSEEEKAIVWILSYALGHKRE